MSAVASIPALIEISENNDTQKLEKEYKEDNGAPFKFKDKAIETIKVVHENKKNTLETTPFNYYIGVEWLVENKIAVSVVPKLDKNSKTTTNFLEMFFSCLEDPKVAEHTGNLYDIRFEEPLIAIEKAKDILTPLLIIHYLRTIKEVVRKGLRKSYYPKKENLAGRIKGKININQTLTQNIFKNRPHYCYCSYDEFGFDTIENRILKKALLLCQKAIGIYAKDWSTYTQPLFDYCSPAFDAVGDEVELRQLKFFRPNVFYQEYQTALHLARLILKRFGYNTKNIEGENETVKIPPFWIDMANLFELYVLKLLRERGKDGTILYQKEGNYGCPDYLFIEGDNKIIMDAKYKTKYNYDEYEIDDIRQLSGYARDTGIMKKLEIKDEKNQDTTVIPCLIIYPKSDNAKIENKGTGEVNLEQLINLKNKEISGFTQFYKIGIHLPKI